MHVGDVDAVRNTFRQVGDNNRLHMRTPLGVATPTGVNEPGSKLHLALVGS
jgi:hypothetical protein